MACHNQLAFPFATLVWTTLLFPETSVHQHRTSYGLAHGLASDQQQYGGGAVCLPEGRQPT